MSTGAKTEAFFFVLLQFIGLMIGFPPLLVLFALPFILRNRDFLLPFMIILPLLEGGYTIEFLIPTETFAILFIGPLILYDIFSKGASLDSQVRLFFLLYFFMIIFGAFVAFFLSDLYLSRGAILGNNLVNIAQLTFFFLLYLAFVQQGIEGIRRSLNILTYIGIPLILSIFIYMQFKGVVYGFKGYLNFGDTRHGTFTATLVALSAYVFFRLVAKGNGIWSRVLAGLSLALALWIVLSAGSRNGLLSFGIMIALSVLVLRGTQLGIKRILLLAFGSLVVVVLLGSFWNHPTVVGVRGILQDENSINEISTGRTKLWLTGIQGFLERPLTGQGGDPSLSRNFALTRVGMDNVAHNTIVEMLLQYGLLGLTMYVFLQSLIIRTYFSLKRVIYTDPMEEDGVFLIPFLSYFSLLFSSLFVSWLWSSMVWYHVSLLLAILTLYRRSLIESTEIESES